MASCRDIKKDINFLADQMMSECFSFLEYSPICEHENVIDIMHDVEQLRINLIYQVNNPGNETTNLKKYYQILIENMYKQNMELLEQLNGLVQ